LERIVATASEKDREARYQPAKAPVRKRAAKALWAAVAAAVLLTALLVYLYLGRGQAIDSLAVLPMVNASADTSIEYLTDGITESLINSLSQLPKLRVMSRSSVFRYKGRDTDPKVVGRELRVRAVLMSRLVERGENLSISAELVDARDNTHIWGEQYNRKLADLQAVQEDIGREITDKLRLKLSGEQKKSFAKRQTQNSEAYQDYLKGRFYWNKRSAAGIKIAIEHFNTAIAKDPTFALAYAGLADSYAVLSTFAAVPPRECFPKARAAALKALEIDDNLGEAHAVLGEVKVLYDFDWAAAESEFKRAIELNPGYATAHQWYALYLARTGRFEEAIGEIKKAQQLDPLSLIVNSLVGSVFRFSRRYDEAIEQLRQTLAMDPSFGPAHINLGQIYVRKRMYSEAIAEFRAGLKFAGEDPRFITGLGCAYALSGNQVEARKILAELLARSKRGYFPAHAIATVYIALGDKDRAFEWLGKAVEERGEYVVWLKVEPGYDPLRSDPRFADLLRRLNLP
jgi:TolB-like protein/Tfp pilus assembly protein PilF